MNNIIAAVSLIFGSAFASTVPAVTPARQAVIESHMPGWVSVKQRAQKMDDAFLMSVTGSNADRISLRAQVATAWKVCQSKEARETLRQQRLLARVPTGSAGASRVSAVNKVFQLRMLYTYGALLPQMIDSSVQTGGQWQGHQFAGPQFQIEMSDAEMQALLNQYQAASGFTADQFAE